jgi:hypothetical protein
MRFGHSESLHLVHLAYANKNPELPLDIKIALTVLLSALNPAEQKVAAYLTWEI